MNREDCQYCQLAKSKQDLTIYDDELMKAVLSPKPSVPGQIELFPKKHFTIFEQVPDYETEKMFIMANKISTAVFESLGMHGTNIIVNNGLGAGQLHPHFSIQIVPRKERDGLNLEWKQKQVGEEEMSTVELMLKPFAEAPAKSEEPKTVTVEKKHETIKDDSDNYLLRQLRRIP